MSLLLLLCFSGGTVSPYVAAIYFNFFFKQCKIQIGAKNTQSDSVTVSHVKLEEALLLAGQSIPPMAGKPLETRNQEMSDKLRNE